MLQESAVVVAVSSGVAEVEITPSERCRGCGACSSREGGPMMAVVDNHLGARVGDTVQVEMAGGRVLSAAAVAYLLPLAGLLLGATLAAAVAGAAHLPSEPSAVLGSVLGIFLGFLAVKVVDGRAARAGSYNMSIASIDAGEISTTSEGRDAT